MSHGQIQILEARFDGVYRQVVVGASVTVSGGNWDITAHLKRDGKGNLSEIVLAPFAPRQVTMILPVGGALKKTFRFDGPFCPQVKITVGQRTERTVSTGGSSPSDVCTNTPV
jgi:hypothetical protein